jgi:hypothetical protein
VTDHLDNSGLFFGLGVNERLKLLLLSVANMDGVIYYDAVGQAGVYPVV